MSKARVETAEHPVEFVEAQNVRVPLLLNPADLPSEYTLTIFDFISVPPTPLIRNPVLSGQFYRLPGGFLLPVGMRFGIDMFV